MSAWMAVAWPTSGLVLGVWAWVSEMRWGRGKLRAEDALDLLLIVPAMVNGPLMILFVARPIRRWFRKH